MMNWSQATLRTNVPTMLFERAFTATREPRSRAYQEGVLALLEWRDRRMGTAPGTPERDAVVLACPYAVATAEHDAWYAGVAEGQLLWRQHTSEVIANDTPRRRRSAPRARG